MRKVLAGIIIVFGLIFLATPMAAAADCQFTGTGLTATEYDFCVKGDDVYYLYTSPDRKQVVLGIVYENGAIANSVIYESTNNLAAPAIDKDSDGNLHIAFIENLGTSMPVRYTKISPAGVVDPLVNPGNAKQLALSLAVDENDVVHLTFIGGKSVWYCNSADKFTSLIILPNPGEACYQPSISCTPQGVLVGYYAVNGSKKSSLVARKIDRNSFELLAQVDEGARTIDKVTVDTSDTRVFMTTDYSATSNVAFLRSYEEGKDPAELKLINCSTPNDSCFVLDDQGLAHVIYWDAGTYDINLYSWCQRGIDSTVCAGVYQSVSRMNAVQSGDKIIFAFLEDGELVQGSMQVPVHLMASTASDNPDSKPVRGALNEETALSFTLQAQEVDVAVSSLEFSLNQSENIVSAQVYRGEELVKEIEVGSGPLVFDTLGLTLEAGEGVEMNLRLTSAAQLADGVLLQAALSSIEANGYVKLKTVEGSLVIDNTGPTFTWEARAGENNREVVLTVSASEPLLSGPEFSAGGTPLAGQALTETTWQATLDLSHYPGETIAIVVTGEDLAGNSGQATFSLNKRDYLEDKGEADTDGGEDPVTPGTPGDGEDNSENSVAGNPSSGSGSKALVPATKDGQEFVLTSGHPLVLSIPQWIRTVKVRGPAASFVIVNVPVTQPAQEKMRDRIFSIEVWPQIEQLRAQLNRAYLVRKDPNLLVQAEFREPPVGAVVHRSTRTRIIDYIGPTRTVVELEEDGIYAAANFSYPFKDGQEHWAYPHVLTLWMNGIIHGTPAGFLELNRPVTRAELCCILQQAAASCGKRLSDAVPGQFSDVHPQAWYYEPVTRAAAAGWLRGFSHGKLYPAEYVTREQAASIFATAMELPAAGSGQANQLFTDINEISGWARQAVERCVQAGIIRGRPGNRLAPRDFLTRAEAFAMTCRWLELEG